MNVKIYFIKFLSYLFIFALIACNASTDNEDGKADNFKFSEDQLGNIRFSESRIDFRNVVLDNKRERLVEIENSGKLPVIFGETSFDGKKSAESFYYSGDTRSFPGESGTCGEVLESKESCLISLTFLPYN